MLEIGPGRGILTECLYALFADKLYMIEVDKDLIAPLENRFSPIASHIINGDFLQLDIGRQFTGPLGVIGNFPYNISSQIVFKIIENRRQIPEMVGMFQREVAQRITASPGNKSYGILSVWAQTFYKTEYLFTVSEGSFNPPPKVKSGVIRLSRKEVFHYGIDENLLLQIIKQAFHQRRKTLRNALSIYKDFFGSISDEVLDKRAEQLSHEDYIALAEVFGRKQ